MKSGISSYFDTARRNCTLCYTYRNFKPSNEQKDLALTSAKRAYEELRSAFDAMRKENASIEKLGKIKLAKGLCLDAIDACSSCDKERPRIKEILIDIK